MTPAGVVTTVVSLSSPDGVSPQAGLTPGPDEKVYTAADRMAELKMFGWFAVFVFGIILFGFPYAAPIIVALYLHFSWGERWYVSLGAAAFAWAILHGIFDYVLGLPLFEGLVYQWIYG